MNPKTLSLLHAEMQRVNALERVEREEHYAYLQSRGEADESFEDYMAKYASLARLATPASETLLVALQGRSAVPLPESLLDFYRGAGGFRGGNRLQGLIIHDAEIVVTKCAPNPQEPWDCLRSMGLIDMILWSWGNDRFEFKPESGDGLSAAEVAMLNHNYSIAGWRPVEEGEGFQYLYFDRDGRFDILHYHQDAFDELYAESLRPMLQQSLATLTFDEAMAALLASAAKSDWDDDE
jgi:hypothetical protein